MMQRGKHMKYTLDLLDNMEGHEFEYAVADLLRHNGFREVQIPSDWLHSLMLLILGKC